jgi:hypothetical protein
MVKAGLSSEVIVAKIKSSTCEFDTSSTELANLKKAGVPDAVILVMVQPSAGRRAKQTQDTKHTASPVQNASCTWTLSGGATKDVKSVTVSYQDAGSYDAGKRLMQQTQAAVAVKEGTGKMTDESATGVGDDAYYTTMGTGYTGLMLKKGNVALKVAVYGDMPADKKKAVEKTLALQALSKL